MFYRSRSYEIFALFHSFFLTKHTRLMKKLALFLPCLLFVVASFAQRTISGRVADDKGVPMANVSISVKGTTTGTTSKVDGTYSLTVPANARTLVFTSVDM